MWLQTKGTSTTRIGTVGTYLLTAADIENFDVIIIDRLPKVFTADEAQVLADWVAAGGGIISMAGYYGTETDLNQQNSLVSQFGMTYATPIQNDPDETYLTHPITDGIGGVQVKGGWLVEDTSTGSSTTSWAHVTGNVDQSLGRTDEHGAGTVIVFSDEWISFDSEWTTIPGVEVLWQNMFNWVAPPNFCANTP